MPTKKRVNKNNKTRRKRKRENAKAPVVQGSILFMKEGWKVIHVYGDAFSRGYSHGYLLREEMAKIPRILRFVVKHELEISQFTEYKSLCKRLVKPIIKTHFAELYEELQGMVMGANHEDVSVDTLIEWNCVLSMYAYVEGKKRGDTRCSAFIATGDATTDGKIVMAHNTHSDFVSANTQNIIQYMTPTTGTPFVMQCAPGFIASGSDWFICANGMIGCECTIGDMREKPEFGYPYFCRIRMAMQYGNTIDEYVEKMLDNNAGDYACSWMFGNIHTNEIALLELGKHNYSLKRTYNGVYYGMNSVLDYKVRLLDTNDKDLYDLSTSSGSRNSRLDFLLNKEYYGRLDRHNAKTILADHYDSYTNKTHRSERGLCSHNEVVNEDEEWDYSYPYGCTDGKVVDAKQAANMSFDGRFGSSCGRIFNANKYIDRHPSFESWRGILPNFYDYDWIKIGRQ